MLSERQMEILNLARAQRRVSVDELAEKFSVTSQTIRRELNDLCQRQMLQRVHGGAVMLSGIENVAYDSRRVLAPEAKRRIGVKTASLIPSNCALFINIGTTTEQVAQALTGHVGLVAITNNINVANILRPAHGIEVIVAGGVVRRSDGGIVGEATVDFINQLNVDYALIGATALDQDGTILDYDYREVWVSQAIMRNARQVILVADAMKFRRSAPMRIGHFSQINVFVTDEELAEPLAKIAAESGVQVEIASE
jgi:DeoR family glycerol-3-phosphate regulon repressor